MASHLAVAERGSPPPHPCTPLDGKPKSPTPAQLTPALTPGHPIRSINQNVPDPPSPTSSFLLPPPQVFSLITTIRQVVASAREAQGPRRALLVSIPEVQPIMQVLDQVRCAALRRAVCPAGQTGHAPPLPFGCKPGPSLTHNPPRTQIELHHLGMAAPVHRHVQPPARATGEIYYLCVIEEEDFHVGVFVLPPRARIPLHDHPGLWVIY